MFEKQIKAIEIEINSRCNLQCSYCPNSLNARESHGTMSVEMYHSLIDQLHELNFSGRISYDFYNEPLLSKNLLNYVSYTKNKLSGSFIEIYSNGTLLTLEKFRDLVSAGVDQFLITKHEGVKSNYIFPKTLNCLTEDERAMVIYREHEDIVKFNRGGTLGSMHDKEVKAFTPCHIPEAVISITHDGNVLPCFEDVKETLIMGNLKEKSLIDIWNSEKYVTFRKHLRTGLRHLYGVCKNCDRYLVKDPY